MKILVNKTFLTSLMKIKIDVMKVESNKSLNETSRRRKLKHQKTKYEKSINTFFTFHYSNFRLLSRFCYFSIISDIHSNFYFHKG